MKLLSYIGHPLVLLFCYSIIMISGETWGGPYLEYVLLGLHGAALHSYVALAGVAIVLFSYGYFKRKGQYLVELILNVAGLLVLIYSLVIFFVKSDGYNDATFHQGVPIASLVLFGVVGVCYILFSMMQFNNAKPITS